MNFLNRFGLAVKLLLGMEVKDMGSGGSLSLIGDSQYGKAQKGKWNSKAGTEALKASTWLYAGTSAIAEAFSSVPVRVERWDAKTQQWVSDPEHPAQLLLDKPNPHQSLQAIKERWAYHMVLAGNALWYLNTGGKDSPTAKILEIWPVNPHEMAPIPHKPNWLAGYEFKPDGGQKITLPPSMVAHWMLTDPLNPYWGLSKLQAAARAVDTDIAAANWNTKMLQNDAQPRVAVMLSDKLTPPQWLKAREMLMEQNAGPEHARKMFVAGGATDIKPLALNAAELDWLAGREFSREEIGAVLGVPSILMSAGQNVTFTNLDAAERIFWTKTIVTLMSRFCEGLTLTILPHFGAVGTHRIAPDFSGIMALQESLKEKADTAKVFVDAGWPLNEVNERLGLGFKPVKGGDVPFSQQQAPSATPTASKSMRVKADEDGVAAGSDKDKSAWEKEITKQLETLINETGILTAEAYASGDWEQAIEDNKEALQTLLTTMHQSIIEQAGPEAYAAFTQLVSGVTGAFDALSPAVTDWIDERALESATSITGTQKDAARAIIKAGTEEGLSSREIARNLRDRFETLSKTQSETIAITEVNGAFSNANNLAASQFSGDHDIPMRKKWRAAGDARTRSSHKSLNGKVVEMSEDFKANLGFPHDPRAPADETIRCRCVVQYIPILDE